MSPKGRARGPAAARTHVGCVRETNEDFVAVAADGRLLLCADGLGGLPCGEVASRLATESLAATLGPLLGDERGSGRRWPARLKRAFLAAHDAVRQAAAASPERREMATTLVAAVVTPRRAHVCHVGDVRAYRASRGRLCRLTDDHSVVFEAVRDGQLSVEQARTHPRRHIVTQALGVPDAISPAVASVPLRAGDLLLLCSDGLWETMTEEDLASILRAPLEVEPLADALVARALAAGGPDNVSVVVYRHR